MLLLGIDLETTGTDIESDEIIEIAGVAWDSFRNAPLKIVSELIIPQRKQLNRKISHLTGIEPPDLRNFGVHQEEVLMQISQMAKKCSYFVGHNGFFFDKPLLERAFLQHGMKIPKLKWIDTAFDIPYPEGIVTRKLNYLAAEHEIIPLFKHRALFDILATLKILSKYELDEILEISESPFVTVVADVSYAKRNQAAELGFIWNPEEKFWAKKTRELIAERARYPFKTKKIL